MSNYQSLADFAGDRADQQQVQWRVLMGQCDAAKHKLGQLGQYAERYRAQMGAHLANGVDAIAALGRPDVYAVWIGDGPLRREMERRAGRRGLQGRFACTGYRDDVPELLPGLDVFVMASRYEGLPCAVVEAMTAGLPVVATAVNSVPDVVLPGETGLLAGPGRPRQLTAAVRHMLDEPAEAARMAAAGQRLIADRFTPDALGAVLGAAYGNGASSPSRPLRHAALPQPA